MLLIVARMLGPLQYGAFAGVAALAVILGTLLTLGIHLSLELAAVARTAIHHGEESSLRTPECALLPL